MAHKNYTEETKGVLKGKRKTSTTAVAGQKELAAVLPTCTVVVAGLQSEFVVQKKKSAEG
jgi:hypothetical protein